MQHGMPCPALRHRLKALAAVDEYILAGDIAPLVGAEEPDDPCQVLLLAIESQRDALLHRFRIILIGEGFPVAVRIDHAGSHVVDGDARLGQLHRKRAGHACLRAFR